MFCYDDYKRNKYHIRIIRKQVKARIEKESIKSEMHEKKWQEERKNYTAIKLLSENIKTYSVILYKLNLTETGNVIQKLLHWCVLAPCDSL